MALDCSVIISTFGNFQWQLLAQERAIPSAQSFGIPVIYNHGTKLHEARNKGLEQVETDYVVHLDADDTLTPDFFEHMSKVDGDIRVPSVNHVYENVTFMPKVVGLKGVHNHMCTGECLTDGNWICVGAVAKTELLKEVGGWKEWNTFEDWCLWSRCWIAGATITPVPKAVYKAYSTSQGRCKNLPQEEQMKIYHEIRKTNFPHLYEDPR